MTAAVYERIIDPAGLNRTMVSLMSLLIGVLAAVAVFAYRRAYIGVRSRATLSDEQIERIVNEGTLEIDDEPLDLDAIRDHERDFWEETWDEPEEL